MERTRQQHYQIFLAFFISLFFVLVFPSLLLTYFAPFIIIVMYKRPLFTTLCWALGCGFIMDCLAGYPFMGAHATSYILATLVIRTQRQNFFDYYASTLPVMSFFFAMISTLTEWMLLNLYGVPLQMSPQWILTDLLIYPALDALYAYCIFTLPPFFMPRSPKHEYFL